VPNPGQDRLLSNTRAGRMYRSDPMGVVPFGAEPDRPLGQPSPPAGPTAKQDSRCFHLPDLRRERFPLPVSPRAVLAALATWVTAELISERTVGGGRQRDGARRGRGAARASASPHVPTPTSRAKIVAWLWWRSGPGRRSPVQEDFQELPALARAGLLKEMRRFRTGEARAGLHFKPLGDGIFELRLKRAPNIYRLLFFMWYDRAVIVDVFVKKERRTDKRRAIDRADAWRAAFPDGPPKGQSG
jgi:phage-related protein